MLYLLIFALGSSLGSFFCLVVERLGNKESIIYPGSKCNACGEPLRFYELIPVFSVLCQKFRCRHCYAKLPKTYLFSEVSFGCFAILLYHQNFSVEATFIAVWLFSGLLLCLTDLLFYHVEPKILYPAVSLMLLLNLRIQQQLHWENLILLLLIFYLLYHFIPESFGGGDVQLLFGWSLFLTTYQLAVLIFLASSLGLLAFLTMKLLQRTQKRLPFVPFLVAALIFVLAFV